VSFLEMNIRKREMEAKVGTSKKSRGLTDGSKDPQGNVEKGRERAR